MFRTALTITTFILKITMGALSIGIILITILLVYPEIFGDLDISFNNGEISFSLLIILIYLVIIATIYAVWKFHTVLIEFLRHRFFSNRVVKNLFYTSYASIFIWVLSLFEFAEAISRSSKFTIEVGSDSFGRSSLFVGLVLYIFAKVFEKAKELADENQLTI